MALPLPLQMEQLGEGGREGGKEGEDHTLKEHEIGGEGGREGGREGGVGLPQGLPGFL